MSYSWAITKDRFAESDSVRRGTENRKGTVGPGQAALDYDEILAHPGGHKFRMKCDDDDVIYEGIFVGDADSEEGFAPLEDFGTPDFGCTSIEYWNIAKMVWEQL